MQFIDQATIEVIAGKGGDGIVAFRREKYVPAGGPSGGNGGKGGSIHLVAVENLQTLLDFQYARFFKAEDGKRGGPNNCTGANGGDRIVKVPCGTTVYNAETEEIIADLIREGQTICVAKGGKGGLGNQHFLSNRNRAPEYALPGSRRGNIQPTFRVETTSRSGDHRVTKCRKIYPNFSPFFRTSKNSRLSLYYSSS